MSSKASRSNYLCIWMIDRKPSPGATEPTPRMFQKVTSLTNPMDSGSWNQDSPNPHPRCHPTPPTHSRIVSCHHVDSTSQKLEWHSNPHQYIELYRSRRDQDWVSVESITYRCQVSWFSCKPCSHRTHQQHLSLHLLLELLRPSYHPSSRLSFLRLWFLWVYPHEYEHDRGVGNLLSYCYQMEPEWIQGDPPADNIQDWSQQNYSPILFKIEVHRNVL